MDQIAAFLSEKDRDAIIASVKDAESRTSGEIVPMVVTSSSEYPAVTFLAILVFSMCAGTIAAFAVMQSDSAFVLLSGIFTSSMYHRMLSLLVFLAVFLPSLPIFRALVAVLPVIRKIFLTRQEMEEQVDETAHTAFHRHHLDRTAERNGILIFISIYERMVTIIADSGINGKVEAAAWKEIADSLASGMRKGDRARAIGDAVRRCGDILAKHFPRGKGDRDELENLIVEK